MKEQKEIVGSISLEEILAKEAREDFNKLIFFSEPIKRGCSPEIEKQDELSRQRWTEKVISSLDRLEKLEKVLRIIKEKKVAISILFMSSCAYVYNELYDVVIIPRGSTPKREWKLTETEFNSLKEVLL